MPIMLHTVNVQSTGESLLPLLEQSRAVQRTVVPGNWKGGRQSDSSIVLMMKGNAFGGKGTVSGNILGGNLLRYSAIGNAGKQIPGRKLLDTQRSDRRFATWGARCRKAARRDLLGACLARGTSTNQRRTSGSVGGRPREGSVYPTVSNPGAKDSSSLH